MALSPAVLAATLVVALVAASYARQYARLSHIPGPFLARFSNLPRLWWVYRRDAHSIHIAQHRQYGAASAAAASSSSSWAPLVRYGPNAVSVGSAAAMDTVYRLRGDPLRKSDFYRVIPPMRKGAILPTIFAAQDESLHRMLKRPVAAVYSMSNLVSFEPAVDRTIHVLRHELERRFVHPGEACDLGAWLQYFAFDVVGEITFSKRLGFLEQGRDVDGIMASIWQWFEYVAVVGQMPWLDSLWVKNKIVSRLRPARWSPMVQFANKCEAERRAAVPASAEGEKPTSQPVNEHDFLSRFLAVLKKDPTLPAWALPAWTSSNIIAGSDTTAIFLRTIFHQLLLHPASLRALRAELDAAAAQDRLSAPATWKQSTALPYLAAVFKEAGRIHPPFGLHLERVVPRGGAGLAVCGATLPPGTVVGMNAWVVHRDPAVFGPDADAWRPERWLPQDGHEDAAAAAARIKRMDAALLTFGAGHRLCLGKHISYLEIFKLVPTLLQAYDMELVDGGKAWTAQNRWFVPQFGFHVRLRTRQGGPGNLEK